MRRYIIIIDESNDITIYDNQTQKNLVIKWSDADIIVYLAEDSQPDVEM